jgi:hypothetical protein
MAYSTFWLTTIGFDPYSPQVCDNTICLDYAPYSHFGFSERH